MKVTLIVPVLNEEGSIPQLIKSISEQTLKPSEVIFVDGGSKDKTVDTIRFEGKKLSYINLKVLIKEGNRSAARNKAINSSINSIIACTDAGCILDKNWLKNITKPFINKKVDVVAGYYRGKCKTVFQKCLTPYALVMPDKVDADKFLPATRSMALRKKVWEVLGGFPEEFSNNEDYVFSNKLKDKFEIYFAKNAIVEWIPRKNAKEAFNMFFRFALGDAQSKIFRPKVFLIFLRYLIGLVLLLSALNGNKNSAIILLIFVVFYISWSVEKNYKYVNDFRALYILPELQFLSDIAVMSGTLFGLFV